MAWLKRRVGHGKVNFYDFQVYCLKGWFLHSSWLEKLRIAKEFVTLTASSALKILVRNLTPEYIKSIIYSNCQTENNFTLDVVPQDNNRMLSAPVLHSTQKFALVWYKSLTSNQQFSIILALIKLGGPAFTTHLLRHIKTVICTRNQVELLTQQLSFVKLADSVFRTPGSSQHDDNTTGMLTPSNMYNGELETALAGLDREILKLYYNETEEEQQQKRSKKEGKKKESKKEAEVVDKVQLLPLWINRAILKQLDAKDLTNAKKVNEYWSVMVDSLKKEQTARAAVDKQLAKIATEKPAENKDRGNKKGKAKIGAKKTKKPKSAKTVLLTADENVAFQNPPEPTGLPVSEVISKPQDFTNVIFTKYNIITRFSSVPVSCVNHTGRLLAVAVGQDVWLHSLISGYVSRASLSGHAARVTAVKFHCNGDLLTASCDNTIRRWKMGSGSLVTIYHGHTEPIVAITVTDQYVASVTQNSVIKVFHIDGGYCVWTEQWPANTPTDLQMSANGDVCVCSEQGFIGVYHIHDRKPTEHVVAHQGRVNRVLLDRGLMFSAGVDGYVRLWDCSHVDSPLAALNHEAKSVTCMCMSGIILISGCSNSSLSLWNTKTAELLRKFDCKYGQLGALHTFKYVDHIKIVLHFTSKIQILKFPVREKIIQGRTAALRGMKSSTKEERIKSLTRRCCTNCLIRRKTDMYTHLEPVVLHMIKQNESLAKHVAIFPRMWM